MRLGVGAALVDGGVVAGDVEVADGRVAAVGLPGGAPGTVAVPGFVDLQVNGFGGVELRHADAGGYATCGAALAAHGVVAYQPTFFSASVAEYVDALGVLAAVRAAAVPASGPALLPAHLEGPFLSPAWAGAHRPGDLLAPDRGVLDRLLAAGPVGMVTLAPELPGAAGLIAACAAAGVVVSVGHSDADAATVRAALDAGARHLTHCCNAHRRFAARDPGPAGVALTDARCTVGLIADGVHVADETALLVFAAAAGRVALTADAIPPAGTGQGTWHEHGRAVTVADGAARLDDGTLAGGVATPDALLRRLLGLGVGLAEVADALGGAQRRLLGVPDVRLRPGDVADVVVLDDALAVRRTLVGGRVVHDAA